MKNNKFYNHLFFKLSWDDVSKDDVIQIIQLARKEDLEAFGLAKKPIAFGDFTTNTLVENKEISAKLVARKRLCICGVELVKLVLDVYDGADGQGKSSFKSFVKDGDILEAGQEIGIITGFAKTILQAERILLNFVQHLSGVATLTNEYVQALSGSNTKLLDTRKTTPTFRVLEKYAISCGGGYNHRMGLFDRIMLKDNHLSFTNASKGERLALAVENARKCNPDLAIEVEVDNLEQIPFVLQANADVIMFDNFSLEDLHKAQALVGDQAWTEISGNVSIETLPTLGKIACDFVSTSATITRASWIDIGLDS